MKRSPRRSTFCSSGRSPKSQRRCARLPRSLPALHRAGRDTALRVPRGRDLRQASLPLQIDHANVEAQMIRESAAPQSPPPSSARRCYRVIHAAIAAWNAVARIQFRSGARRMLRDRHERLADCFGKLRSSSVIFSTRQPGIGQASVPASAADQQRQRHGDRDAVLRVPGSKRYSSGSALPATSSASGWLVDVISWRHDASDQRVSSTATQRGRRA